MTEIVLKIKGPLSSTILKCYDSITLKDLRGLISLNLNLDEVNIDLFGGFPLKRIDFDIDSPINGHICGNQTITVRLKSEIGAFNAPNKSPQQVSSQSPAPFRREIYQSSPLVFGARIATISNIGGTIQEKRKNAKRKRVTKMKASSEDDIGTHLLAAVSGGTKKQDRFLRAAFRRAVELQYDQSTAQARVASALSGSYTMEECVNYRALASGASTKMNVTFHKGLGSRRSSTISETVDLLSVEQLKAIVSLVLASDSDSDSDSSNNETRETLRSTHMAGCSPRVFWSLVRLYGGDVLQGLQSLMPDKDWLWMTTRRRELSEKAKYNLHQKQTRSRSSRSIPHHPAADTPSVQEESTPGDDDNMPTEQEQTEALITALIAEVAALVPLTGDDDTMVIPPSPPDRLPVPVPVPVRLLRALGSMRPSSGHVLLASYVLLLANSSPEHIIVRMNAMESDNIATTTTSIASATSSLEEVSQCIDRVRAVWSERCWDCLWRRFVTANTNDQETETETVEVVKRSLRSLGITGPSQLAVWRHAPETLLQEARAELEAAGIDVAGLRRAAEVCFLLRDRFPWLQTTTTTTTTTPSYSQAESGDVSIPDKGYDDDDVEEEGEGEARRRMADEGWVLVGRDASVAELDAVRGQGGGFAFLGRDVVVQLEEEDEEADEGSGLSRQVQGWIMGYLPSTPDEPMALWKAQLSGDWGIQDLEEDELMEALSRSDCAPK
eukprot:gene4349-8656_t